MLGFIETIFLFWIVFIVLIFNDKKAKQKQIISLTHRLYHSPSPVELKVMIYSENPVSSRGQTYVATSLARNSNNIQTFFQTNSKSPTSFKQLYRNSGYCLS